MTVQCGGALRGVGGAGPWTWREGSGGRAKDVSGRTKRLRQGVEVKETRSQVLRC